MTIGGDVELGFEGVAAVLEENQSWLGDGGGAFCAYHAGRKVVDLWAGMKHAGVPWEADTTAVLMSASKGMTSTCALILYDRGRLDLDAPVAEYWPEFSANGKDGIRVRDILSHQSGCTSFPGHAALLQFDGTGWDRGEAIAAALAGARPEWEPRRAHGYHALTYGYLVGEIVRRIDGRSLGEFFRAEVALPLRLDSQIGTPSEAQGRVATCLESMVLPLPPETQQVVDAFAAAARDETTITGRTFVARGNVSVLDVIHRLACTPQFLSAEVGSGNATSSARSLAKMYAAFAAGGELDGVRVASPGAIEVFQTKQREDFDMVRGGFKAAWALGFERNYAIAGLPNRLGPNLASFGYGGAGGQIGFADPDNRLSIGFVRSHLSNSPGLSTMLIEAVYESIGLKGRRE